MKNCTDYYLYDKANDTLVRFDNGDIIFYGDKDEAEKDCYGNEYIVQYKDLNKKQKLKIAEQVIKQLKIKTMEKLTHEEVIKYVRWVYSECDTPISEIEWLSEMLINDRPKKDIKKEFIENVKELLSQLNN